MSQGRKGKLNYRCPSCFMRDLDVLEKNEMVRFRYRAMAKRFTKFDFD